MTFSTVTKSVHLGYVGKPVTGAYQGYTYGDVLVNFGGYGHITKLVFSVHRSKFNSASSTSEASNVYSSINETSYGLKTEYAFVYKDDTVSNYSQDNIVSDGNYSYTLDNIPEDVKFVRFRYSNARGTGGAIFKTYIMLTFLTGQFATSRFQLFSTAPPATNAGAYFSASMSQTVTVAPVRYHMFGWSTDSAAYKPVEYRVYQNSTTALYTTVPSPGLGEVAIWDGPSTSSNYGGSRISVGYSAAPAYSRNVNSLLMVFSGKDFKPVVVVEPVVVKSSVSKITSSAAIKKLRTVEVSSSLRPISTSLLTERIVREPIIIEEVVSSSVKSIQSAASMSYGTIRKANSYIKPLSESSGRSAQASRHVTSFNKHVQSVSEASKKRIVSVSSSVSAIYTGAEVNEQEAMRSVSSCVRPVRSFASAKKTKAAIQNSAVKIIVSSSTSRASSGRKAESSVSNLMTSNDIRVEAVRTVSSTFNKIRSTTEITGVKEVILVSFSKACRSFAKNDTGITREVSSYLKAVYSASSKSLVTERKVITEVSAINNKLQHSTQKEITATAFISPIKSSAAKNIAVQRATTDFVGKIHSHAVFGGEAYAATVTSSVMRIHSYAMEQVANEKIIAYLEAIEILAILTAETGSSLEVVKDAANRKHSYLKS